jgi:hypothetical protein
VECHGVLQEPGSAGDIAAKFFARVLSLPQVRKLLSSEHFSVDGTLIEAWASMKSFVPKNGGDPPPGQGCSGGRNAERNFHGEKPKNDTHFSTTDPDARLFRKGAGKEAKLCHMGHLMTENRNGLIVDARLAAPAEMVLRLLILKHIRNWSYGVLEREVRANLVYRGFTRVGAGKTPDAKTMGRWGVAVGPEVVKQIHQKLVKLAQANGLAAGRRMRVDTTGVETKSTIRPIRACWAMACEF